MTNDDAARAAAKEINRIKGHPGFMDSAHAEHQVLGEQWSAAFEQLVSAGYEDPDDVLSVYEFASPEAARMRSEELLAAGLTDASKHEYLAAVRAELDGAA